MTLFTFLFLSNILNAHKLKANSNKSTKENIVKNRKKAEGKKDCDMKMAVCERATTIINLQIYKT